MTAIEQQAAAGDRLRSMAVLVDRANRFVRFIAQPSLVQLVLRFALAVPFWRSGILKWDGFLQLNDTAVTSVHRRVQASSAGRPLSVSGADRDGVPVRLWGNRLPRAARPRVRRPFRGARPSVHDPHRRTDRSGWMAHPHHLGGDGSCDHGVWYREIFARLPPRACRWTFSLGLKARTVPPLHLG